MRSSGSTPLHPKSLSLNPDNPPPLNSILTIQSREGVQEKTTLSGRAVEGSNPLHTNARTSSFLGDKSAIDVGGGHF